MKAELDNHQLRLLQQQMEEYAHKKVEHIQQKRRLTRRIFQLNQEIAVPPCSLAAPDHRRALQTASERVHKDEVRAA